MAAGLVVNLFSAQGRRSPWEWLAARRGAVERGLPGHLSVTPPLLPPSAGVQAAVFACSGNRTLFVLNTQAITQARETDHWARPSLDNGKALRSVRSLRVGSVTDQLCDVVQLTP